MKALVDGLAEFFGFDTNHTYLLPRWLFLRLLGIVALLAFYGWYKEGAALVGPRGIERMAVGFADMQARFGQLGSIARFPTLFRFSDSEGAIALVGGAGMLCSVLLILNVAPRAMLVAIWIFYMSFNAVGVDFIPAQVDMLLLECVFLSIFFAPRGLRPGLGLSAPPHPLAVFAMRWLVFRVMFESGIVKLVSPDAKWFDLKAMDVLYETAPFPTVLGYYAFHLPHWWHVGEVFLTATAELFAPLLALLGGRFRLVAIFIWLQFQLGIELTNNFGWLNFAAIALGLLLFDDQSVRGLLAAVRCERAVAVVDRLLSRGARAARPASSWLRIATLYGLIFLHTFNSTVTGAIELFEVDRSNFTGPLYWLWDVTLYYRTANGYTLYGSTHDTRYQTILSGSDDGGATWKEYKHYHIVQDLDRMPPFIAPYFDRFEASLEVYGHRKKPNAVFPELARALLQGSAPVHELFRVDPFPLHPPQAIRFQRYRYRYTSLEEHRKTGNYWTREYLGEFLPIAVLDRESGRIRFEQ